MLIKQNLMSEIMLKKLEDVFDSKKNFQLHSPDGFQMREKYFVTFFFRPHSTEHILRSS